MIDSHELRLEQDQRANDPPRGSAKLTERLRKKIKLQNLPPAEEAWAMVDFSALDEEDLS